MPYQAHPQKILKHKIFFIVIYFFLPTLILSAQLDRKNGTKEKGKKKGILAIPAKTVKKPKSLENDSKNGFKTAHTKQKKDLAKKRKEDELEDKGILTKAKIAEERFLNSWIKINAPYSVIDQDLGSFRTQSKVVRIICRDFQYPDGDRVTIILNDIPVIQNQKTKSPSPTILEDRLVPVSKMRSIIAQRLLESKNTIPHFYLHHPFSYHYLDFLNILIVQMFFLYQPH